MECFVTSQGRTSVAVLSYYRNYGEYSITYYISRKDFTRQETQTFEL